MPPAALIFTFLPTYFLNRATSSRVAPALEKPVDVLIKSAFASVTILHISIFSSSVKRQVSMMTLRSFPPQAALTASISPRIFS